MGKLKYWYDFTTLKKYACIEIFLLCLLAIGYVFLMEKRALKRAEISKLPFIKRHLGPML
jgi:hypothetical protein